LETVSSLICAKGYKVGMQDVLAPQEEKQKEKLHCHFIALTLTLVNPIIFSKN